MKTNYFKYFLILLAVLFWGNSFIALKITLRELTPETIITLRLVIAVIFLFFTGLFLKNSFSLNLKNLLSIFILAAVSVFHIWIQITGLNYTTAANSGWIIGTAPVFIAVLGMIFFREKINFIKAFGIFVAIVGLLLLVSKGDILSISFIENKGDFLVLASAFVWGVYSIINKKISISYPPLMTIFYLFILMMLIILPFSLSDIAIHSVVHLSLDGWMSIIFLGLFCSGVSYVIWAQALRDMESAKVGAFLYLEPFVTVLAAWLLLDELITPVMMMGGIIIIIGVILVNK
ncbi:DMT family transporter [bacterium BMS3Abin03]|nr:DMT family transporter [bacterium BMS3Abin03]